MDNKNIKLLEDLVDPSDDYGKKYIELIKEAINDNRLCKGTYFTSKERRYKEKFFKEANRSYIYCEVHHIIPRCCGGDDTCDNLVYLYCTEGLPEHVQAHEYLWRSTSLFPDYRSEIAGSFFKMTYSRKLSSSLSIEEAAKLRKEYGEWKRATNSKKYGRNKRANKILYNGVEYPSSNSLTEVEIDGSKHDRHTILDWAKYGLHGLALASGEVFPLPIKEKRPKIGVEIELKGKVYHSARSLVGVELEDGTIFTNHSSILSAARKGLHGLQIVHLKDMKPPKPRKQKVHMTREQRILASSNSIQIEYNGVVYPSARSLENVVLPDGKSHDKGTIISWAKIGKYGLRIIPK